MPEPQPRRWLHRIATRPVCIGLVLVCLTGLFPPTTMTMTSEGDKFYAAGPRTFLLWPPNKFSYRRIDYQRLHTEWLVIASAVGAVMAFRARRAAS